MSPVHRNAIRAHDQGWKMAFQGELTTGRSVRSRDVYRRSVAEPYAGSFDSVRLPLSALRMTGSWRARTGLAPRQREIHRHLRLHFYRVTIEKVGPIAPLPHSIERSPYQHGMSADHLQIFDSPGPADNRPQLDHPLNPRRPCQRWIRRLHSVDEIALHHVRDARRMGHWWRRRRQHVESTSRRTEDRVRCRDRTSPARYAHRTWRRLWPGIVLMQIRNTHGNGGRCHNNPLKHIALRMVDFPMRWRRRRPGGWRDRSSQRHEMQR